jgi:tetratricopeptide (TPR) repeat protein
MQSAEPVEHFTGRAEELARLDRWGADQQVSLIGVTAWGGAGKTSLVTRWVEAEGPARRPGIRGVFGWSFLDDPSAEHWAQGLLDWARQELEIEMADTGRLAATALKLLRTAPVVAVLDGLEVMQEDRDGIRGLEQLLDGLLREVLVGACYQPFVGLIVLTSRFPFGDLEGFDGNSARMLDLPPLTLDQGSALLAAAGGGWLPDGERRALVQAVDGHALATGVLAGLLAARLPDTELAALRSSLAGATQTNARVGRVLEFYADRLSEPDRYLMAAVSLFARPVPCAAVLTVAKHEVFGSRLDEWTPAMVQSAVCSRLAGLAVWHREGSISAHPLVRDIFRHFVMDAAGTAADTALAVVPPGIVTSRADGLRVVEVIELLIDAEQWQTADGIYRARCDNGKIWRRLPAAAFGQRAATAFVATPERRDACARHLGPGLLGFYLGDAGLFAMYAGDLETARRHLRMAADHNRDAGNISQLTTSLRNLAVCLGYLGRADAAKTAAAESVTCAEASGGRLDACESGAYLAWLAGLADDPATAEHQFTVADQFEIADSGYHLYTVRGVWWADSLARTGRLDPAWAVAGRSAEICRKNGWHQNVARSDRMLGRIALIRSDTASATERLTAAAAVFRDGDFVVELAITLIDLAAYAGAAGDLADAEQHATEAIAMPDGAGWCRRIALPWPPVPASAPARSPPRPTLV